MWPTVLLILIAFGLLRSIVLRRRQRIMTVLQRNGIGGPEPHLIRGNLSGYLSTPNVIWDTMLIERYGEICGYYLGAKPVILVADLDLLKKIQSGDHFLDRPRRVPGGINPDLKRTEMLGNLKVPQWKVLRGILSKAFSPDKLQKMSGNVQDLIQVFLSCITPSETATLASAEPQQHSINFYALYQNLTLDLIGNAGFGLDSDIQRNPNDCLKAAVEQEFSKSTDSIMMELYLCFPEVRWLLQPIRIQIEKFKVRMGWGGRSELWDLGLDTVLVRKIQFAEQSEENKLSSSTDLLHLMMQSGKLSEIAIVANSVLFFEAGFETLSASLAFITHLLMINGEIQEQVRKEIKQILEKTEGQLGCINMLRKFKFLDAVIKEGLRMFPPQTTFIGRSGDSEITHTFQHNGRQKDVIIPKDVHVQVALWQILNSDKIWEAPRTFRPQRFFDELTEYQKIAYQPFGRGKRICIGMKYAEMVLKLVFIELFSKYKVIPNEQSEGEDIEVVYKTATMTPKNGVFGSVVWDPLFPAEQ